VPRFAVIVPAYNASGTIRETLDAVLAQDFADWECVIVNDGSTDETPAIVRAYCDRDSRFHLVEQENRGAPAAHNAGVIAASAGLLVLCAADDYLLADHLSTMSELIERNPDCAIYSSNGEYLYESGRKRVVYTTGEWSAERSLSFEEVLALCFFSVGAVYRRDVFDRVGGFRPGVYVDDYDFWLRAMLSGARHMYTPRVLSVHRISATQQSADVVRVYRSNIEVLANLIEVGLVRNEKVGLVEAAIAAREQWILDAEWRQAAEERLAGVRTGLSRFLGPRIPDRMISRALTARLLLRAWMAHR
jgi:glycosyltransferase involved in cell wall biosynthesis